MGRLLVGILAFGLALPVWAETVMIGEIVIRDKDASGRPFNPIIQLLDPLPAAGSTSPICFQVYNLDWGYIYIFSDTHLITWRAGSIRDGEIVAVHPQAQGWPTGSYPLKVIISTHPRWHLTASTYPLSITQLGPYIQPRCYEGIKVAQFFITFAPPIYLPSYPSQPPPCPPCWLYFHPLAALIGLLILVSIVICCP